MWIQENRCEGSAKTPGRSVYLASALGAGGETQEGKKEEVPLKDFSKGVRNMPKASPVSHLSKNVTELCTGSLLQGGDVIIF